MPHLPTNFLIKQAVDLSKLRLALKAFHSAGLADRAHGSAQYAAGLAKRWKAHDAAPVHRVNKLPESSKTLADRKRLDYISQMRQAHASQKAHTRDFKQQYEDVFGAPKTWLGDLGQKAFKNTAGIIYDIPRAAVLHPASKTGLPTFLAVGAGANALGVHDPYDYALPNVVGRAAYLPQAKNDIMNHAQAGAMQGGRDLFDGYSGLTMGQRLGYAKNPNLGVQGNSWSQNPKTPSKWQSAFDLMSQGGGLSENLVRSHVAQGVHQGANQFMKSSSARSFWTNMFGKFRPLKAISRQYNKLPVPARVGMGYAGTMAIPVGAAASQYYGARETARDTAFDQGYNSAQWEAQNAWKNLPTWQRYGAAISPQMAMQLAMRKKQTGSVLPKLELPDMKTTMYRRPDGSEVWT